MKRLFLIIISIVTMYSCEKDDICLEETTPNLIIRFYDAANPTDTKSVSTLDVAAIGLDNLYTDISTDSIVIPLNTNVMSTVFKFTKGNTTPLEDEFTVNYTPEDIFVSRSCGYKSIFNNISATSTNMWIQSIEIVTPTIENETAAHVKIYH